MCNKTKEKPEASVASMGWLELNEGERYVHDEL